MLHVHVQHEYDPLVQHATRQSSRGVTCTVCTIICSHIMWHNMYNMLTDVHERQHVPSSLYIMYYRMYRNVHRTATSIRYRYDLLLDQAVYIIVHHLNSFTFSHVTFTDLHFTMLHVVHLLHLSCY